MAPLGETNCSSAVWSEVASLRWRTHVGGLTVCAIDVTALVLYQIESETPETSGLLTVSAARVAVEASPPALNADAATPVTPSVLRYAAAKYSSATLWFEVTVTKPLVMSVELRNLWPAAEVTPAVA